MMLTEGRLKQLFDYSDIAGNARISAMVRDTLERYSGARALSDDEVEFVCAAGETDMMRRNAEQESAD